MVQRHADQHTSKIVRLAEDLAPISSLGFASLVYMFLIQELTAISYVDPTTHYRTEQTRPLQCHYDNDR